MPKVYLSKSADKRLKDYLKTEGYEIYSVAGTASVSAPVREHADIYYCQLKDYVYKGNESLLNERYPGDVLYNAAALGRYLVCSKYTSSDLVEKSGLTPIIVPQGYVKCNLVILDDNHVITEDAGIYRVLSEYKDIECLLIAPHEVRLDGYAYGFIGGCSGKYKDTLIFNGDISKHSDYEKIKCFAENCGLKIIYFADYPLTDIGSILFQD